MSSRPNPSPVRRTPGSPTVPPVPAATAVHPPGHRPAPVAPAGRGSERRPGGVAGRVSPLSRAVAAALHHLADLSGSDGRAAFVARGRIDRMLREATDRHPDRTNAAAAIRVACAHLVAGDTEDAYLALLTARDMLA